MQTAAGPARGLALVMGASRGLGLLIARELLDRGHDVVITARGAEELEAAARRLSGRGRQVHARVCDVRDREAVMALVEGSRPPSRPSTCSSAWPASSRSVRPSR